MQMASLQMSMLGCYTALKKQFSNQRHQLRSKLRPKLTSQRQRHLINFPSFWTTKCSTHPNVSLTMKRTTSCLVVLLIPYFALYQHDFGDIKEEKMRMRNLYRKATTLRCYAGSRCYSASAVIWSLLGCLLLFHLYSNIHHKHKEGREVPLHVTNHPQSRELQQVEGEIIRLQPKGKRSPRAAKCRHKQVTPLVDE
ncbi:hypothetical protein GmHk_05G013302 [Glycine max]|nr:hypothetical protein GmHk_05G013302 [Glycine max]